MAQLAETRHLFMNRLRSAWHVAASSVPVMCH